MTVFVAGVHGVGKTFLCDQYAKSRGVRHESASSLIRLERDHPSWTIDKKARDIDDNQIALASAVQRLYDAGIPLLLDGHFVLINELLEFVALGHSVFSPLHLSGVVLIEADPQLIASRLSSRDSTKSSVDIDQFLNVERQQAISVSSVLNIPLKILKSPNIEDFSMAVEALFEPGILE